MPVTQMRKRDGRLVAFEEGKIATVIAKAIESVRSPDSALAEQLARRVSDDLEQRFSRQIPNVEDIQDAVERVLIESGNGDVAKSFILYRQRRADIRQAKAALGVRDDLKLAMNAIKVLQSRYLRKNEHGR